VTAPVIVRTRAQLAAARDAMSGRVAVVMTMGALHAGHTALMDEASRHADFVIATIFVNPLQFGAGEDLDRYPRTFDADVEACGAHGVDVIFAPGVEDMYPPGEQVETMRSGELGQRLEGAIRPTHFDGMLTVVAKLLKLTRPDLAVFGEKDAQQLALIRRMVAELAMPVEIIGVKIVREADGLALSSRNRYLDPAQHEAALALSQALRVGVERAADGLEAARAAVAEVLAAASGVVVDYLAVVDEKTWQDADDTTRAARILVAGRLGSTRLIDNVSVVLGTPRVAG
jgi:pantoate--beta-alanine ligase